MKILILVPPQNKSGGISTFYKSLKNYFSSDVEYFERGNRSLKRGISGYLDYVKDYLNFFNILKKKRFDRIIVNTSLEKSNTYRDLIFILIIIFFRKEFILFFHGWNIQYQEELDQNLNSQAFPFRFLKKASHCIVLSENFKNKLIEWKFNKEISVISTAVEDQYVHSFEFNEDKFLTSNNPFNFLFLARIEKNKGALDAVKLFAAIQKALPEREIKLIIAGSGSSLQFIKDFVFQNKIQNVEFLGFVSGIEKINVFHRCQFFLFPSAQEGFPIAMLEAMSFGLPVFCIATGGIKDFFQDEIMGIVQNSLDINIATRKIKELISKPEKMIEIGRFNANYTKQHFLASDIAVKIEIIVKAI
jgi:glycosyltransferase involved in cell wall biosynthesis